MGGGAGASLLYFYYVNEIYLPPTPPPTSLESSADYAVSVVRFRTVQHKYIFITNVYNAKSYHCCTWCGIELSFLIWFLHYGKEKLSCTLIVSCFTGIFSIFFVNIQSTVQLKCQKIYMFARCMGDGLYFLPSKQMLTELLVDIIQYILYMYVVVFP